MTEPSHNWSICTEGGGVYRASCSCGWVSPARADAAKAARDATEHLSMHGVSSSVYDSPTPEPHQAASGLGIVGAVGFHVLAGAIWAFLSLWTLLDRYGFCSNDLPFLGRLFFGLAASWFVGIFVVAWIRSRGAPAWPWSLVWFFATLMVFGVAVSDGPEPTDCGVGFW